MTGSGEALLVMLTLDCVGDATITLVEAELLEQFGSLEEEQGTLILAVLVIVVPDEVVKSTLRTKGKFTEPVGPTAMLWPVLRLQEMVPVPPTGMELQVQLVLGALKRAPRVVPGGMVSVKVATVAGAGP